MCVGMAVELPYFYSMSIVSTNARASDMNGLNHKAIYTAAREPVFVFLSLVRYPEWNVT